MKKQIIDVIIPAYNESESIGKVVLDIPTDWVRDIIVCNNNSSDDTAQKAINAGAVVVNESKSGYGAACLKGMEYILLNRVDSQPDIVVFIDGDYSDYPEQIPELIYPIQHLGYDMVIGSRALGEKQKGSMTLPQVFGNWLATKLISWLYDYEFSDLGPFRAIRYSSLINLNMKDLTFGWTVEMQVKAAKQKLKCTEIPANYRKRIGHSKVSGTVYGTIMAGYKILFTIFKLHFKI